MLSHFLRALSFLAFTLLMVIPFSANVAASPVAMADTLYAHGEYSKAAEAYLAVAKVDGSSPELYFNLANAYAQAGDYGNAMLYYIRAHRLDPSNKEITNNLKYFQSKMEDYNRAELRGKRISVSPDPDTFFQSVRRIICEDVALNVWAVASASAFILLLALIAVYLFCSDVRLRKVGFFGGLGALTLSVFFIVFAFMSASYYDSHDEAVLMAYKKALLIEPSSDSKPAGSQLCSGTVLQIVAEESDVEGNPAWYKVRLNSDIEGWLPAADVSVI